MSPRCTASTSSPTSRVACSPRWPSPPTRSALARDVLIEEGAVEAHLYAVVDGRVRVHRGDRTLVELGPGATVGELAALVPQPRIGHGDRPGADTRPPRSTRSSSTTCSGVAGARARRHRGARRPTARDRGSRRQVAMSDAPSARRRRPAHRAGARLRRDARAPDHPRERAVPGRLRIGMAPGDLHRDRRVRQRRVRAHRPGSPPHAARACRDREPRWPSRLLYARVLGDPRGGWRLGVGGLLVLFPIALQMGFVFIGGQAGRLLDVRQMKELFPRVVSGFAVGFLIGGLLGIPLLALLGSTENLLLATTAAQLAFLGLLLADRATVPGGARRAHEDGSRCRPAAAANALRLRDSSSSCSSTRCCPRWARRWSTSSCSTVPRRSTAVTT